MSHHDDRPDAPEPAEVHTSPSEEVDSTDGDVGDAGIDDSDEVDGPSGDPAGDVGSQGGVSRAGEGAGDGFLDAPVIAESGHVDTEGDLAALGIDQEDQARRGADTDPGAPAGDPVVADPVVADPVVADPVVGDPATAGPGPGLPVGHGRGDHPERSGSPSRGAGVVVGMVLLIL
ncbi:MAG TPA: hypothetical protein VMM13_21335, partial [Euzebya sp.]|nr:hypothetical protein [Euzebya sp.]